MARSPGAEPAGLGQDDAAGLAPRGTDSLSVLAYDRIEDLIVHCELAPGSHVRTQDLQQLVDIGRTPVHQAVRRLAAETLIRIRPRDGLQISPIDLGRDRRLLRLRRDMDRFVVEGASEKLDGNARNRLIRLAAAIRERRDDMNVREFNEYDRQLDATMLVAAGEPFLNRTLRPLHTIFRRSGFVYLTHLAGRPGLTQTIDCHLDLLDAVVACDRKAAVTASDRLIDFADSMFVELENRIDPDFLDVKAY